MFTGIVREVGHVRDFTRGDRDTRFVIATRELLHMGMFERGASVSCSGICLTLVEKGPDWFAVEVSNETMSKTTISSWVKGTAINLEPSLKMGDELGGHLVMGHVDGVAELVSIKPEGGSHRLRLRMPHHLSQFLAVKGSVALDGVSLTVNEVEGDEFGVNIIPYTWDHTTFNTLKVGDKINLETDILARYVQRIVSVQKD